MSRNKTATIRKATDSDLKNILQWLKEEQDANGHSFYCNRDTIKKAHQNGNLYALIGKQGEKAIAFALGKDTIDILAVRESKRGMGYGSVLFDHFEEEARKLGVNVLEIECTPESSISFWKGKGFKMYEDVHGKNCREANRAFKILKKENDVPHEWPSVGVEIGFYDDSALHRDRFDNPLEVFTPLAARDGNRVILIDRVIFHMPYFLLGLPYDPVALVKVDGKEVYKGKAKYEEAEACGIQRDGGYTFFIDEIITS